MGFRTLSPGVNNTISNNQRINKKTHTSKSGGTWFSNLHPSTQFLLKIGVGVFALLGNAQVAFAKSQTGSISPEEIDIARANPYKVIKIANGSLKNYYYSRVPSIDAEIDSRKGPKPGAIKMCDDGSSSLFQPQLNGVKIKVPKGGGANDCNLFVVDGEAIFHNAQICKDDADTICPPPKTIPSTLTPASPRKEKEDL